MGGIAGRWARAKAMPRDMERLDRLQSGMKEAGLDALLCTLPENVLLATGYFPVVGASLAIVTRDCDVLLFAPSDEMDLVDCDAADATPFEPASLETITSPSEAVREPLRSKLARTRLGSAVIGYDGEAAYEPASYASMHLWGNSVRKLFENGRSLKPATDLFRRMKAVLTSIESDRVRRACRIAQAAYERGATSLSPGLRETEAAAQFREPLSTIGIGFEGVARADGVVSCMSGVNSARAHGAYARSRRKEIEIADFVLTHCNSHANGYWTDITRTYCLGEPLKRQIKMYEAVFAARQAALEVIRPGAPAAGVDRAARETLRSLGFGEQFKHSAGHGVGYCAIDHDARPRIHPASDERLEAGMVFNLEPAIYLDGFGGLRHCDMVAVTETGVETLTPFQCCMEDLIR